MNSKFTKAANVNLTMSSKKMATLAALGGVLMVTIFALYRGGVGFMQPHAISNMVKPTSDGNAWMWNQANDGIAKGRMSIEDGALRCEITTADFKNPNSIIVFTATAKVVAGRSYRVHFMAKADRERTIGLTAYRVSGLDSEVALSTDWAPYNYSFIAGNVWRQPSRLPRFELAKYPGTVWIKDVSVVEVY